MEQDTHILSYGRFLLDRQNFRKAGTKNGNEFNLFDTPAKKYFKILFYFGNDDNDKNRYLGNFGFSNGLLTPTWLMEDFSNSDELPKNLYEYNSAWAYLKLNAEDERAEKLKQFVHLLSNINSNSPWYFNSIEGIQEALDRKPASGNNFEFNETKKITIGCLSDAFDNRITTLLDLYRDITWSWKLKKEILPSNLRKFDMAIFIFETPTNLWHSKEDYLSENSTYIPSYKMLEFHNCEIDYNSIKSGWAELNNSEGVSPTYKIEISYDDCYEVNWNEFSTQLMGDIIQGDTEDLIINRIYHKHDKELKNRYTNIIAGEQQDITDINSKVEEQLKKYKKREFENGNDLGTLPQHPGSKDYNKGFLVNAVDQLVGVAKNWVVDKIERAVLGNLYTYSLTKIADQAKTLLQGGVIQTVQAAKDYSDNIKQRKEVKQVADRNIFSNSKKNQNKKPNSNIFKDITIINNI